jgi:hypothetical protein
MKLFIFEIKIIFNLFKRFLLVLIGNDHDLHGNHHVSHQQRIHSSNRMHSGHSHKSNVLNN